MFLFTMLKNILYSIIYLFVIFHLIVCRHCVIPGQNTFLFDMKCMLKMANKVLYYYYSLVTLHRSRNEEAEPSHVFAQKFLISPTFMEGWNFIVTVLLPAGDVISSQC